MPGNTFAFDNLKDAADGWLFGSRPWVERRVVLDVSAEAISLHFGFSLKGRGNLWLRIFALKRPHSGVDSSASSTTVTGSRVDHTDKPDVFGGD